MGERTFLTKALLGGAVATLLLAAACGSSNNNSGSSNTNTAATAASSAPPATIALIANTPATGSTPAAAATPVVNPTTRINGAVQSVSGSTVMLSGNASFMLSPQTLVTKRVAASASDLKVGNTVAVTATRQPDNTLLATLINVFPAAPNGFPLGQSPLSGGDLMTNATIDKVSGSTFSVTYPGGGAQVTLAPNAQIMMLVSGTSADIVPGVMVTASVRDGVAQNVSIGSLSGSPAPLRAASPTPYSGY